LVRAVAEVHQHFTTQAGKAVNVALTLRNWLIGAYIRDYEQNGNDRARYGTGLLDALAERLTAQGVIGVAARSLRLYRQFYLAYPAIWQSLTTKSNAVAPLLNWPSPPTHLQPDFTKSDAARPAALPSRIEAQVLLTRLSFTLLAELVAIDGPHS
jgi:hypothetical protein